MTSSVLTRFNEIEYYDSSDNLIKSKSVVYSNDIKNEMLGMMNADFADEESPAKIELLEGLDLSLSELEVLSELSIYQSDYEELNDPDKYDSYTTSLGEKLIIIRAPKECVKLVLVDTESNTKYDISFNSNNQFIVPEVDRVEKMVLVTQSGSSNYVNPSVLIHENSNHPHSNLSFKILTADEFFNLVISEEVVLIDDKIIHSKSDSIIGIGLESYFDNLTSKVTIDGSDKLLINNRYL